MKIIQLTQGYETLVDDNYYDFLMRWNWFPRIDSKRDTIYVSRNNYDNDIWPREMHRAIMMYSGIDIKDWEIDHKDRNGLNNQKDNLRLATRSQNCINNRLRKDSTTGYKGVSYYAKTRKWLAQLQYNREKINIGYYKTIEEAAIAYNKAAKRYFGEFAFLNELPEHCKTPVKETK